MSLAEKCYIAVTLYSLLLTTVNITLLIMKIEKDRARWRELRRREKLRHSERAHARALLRENNKQITMLYYDILGGKYNNG